MAREKQSERIEAMEAQMSAIMGMLQSITGGATAQQTPPTVVAKQKVQTITVAAPTTTIPPVQPVTIQASGSGFTLTAQNQFSFRKSQNGNPLSGSHGWEKVVDPTTGKQYRVNIMIMES